MYIKGIILNTLSIILFLFSCSAGDSAGDSAGEYGSCTDIGCVGSMKIKFDPPFQSNYKVSMQLDNFNVAFLCDFKNQSRGFNYRDYFDSEEQEAGEPKNLTESISLRACFKNGFSLRGFPDTIEILISSVDGPARLYGTFSPEYELSYPNGYECDRDSPCRNGEITVSQNEDP